MFIVRIDRLRGLPLFPYTTLFRSFAVDRPRTTLPCDPPQRERPVRAREQRRLRPDQGSVFRLRGSRLAQQDRKSTRLNSSHLVISYAVFCWKKKINPIQAASIAPH